VIGLSILSGAHLTLSRKVLDRLREAGAGDVALVVGGTIPAGDAEALVRLGVRRVFPMGTPLPDIVNFFKSIERGANCEAANEAAGLTPPPPRWVGEGA